MRFYGNKVCCCSYACLNAMQYEDVDVQMFEISTSAPFGVRHCREEHFDRLLTTFKDPNQGVDKALELWGCEVEKYLVLTAKEAIEIIRQHLYRGRIVLGPVDMGALCYQPVSSLLQRMDHYIMLEYLSKEAVLCFDSEGFYSYPLSYGKLEQCISIKGIIEAKTGIILRLFLKRKSYSIENILMYSLKNAFVNLQTAELCGQGSLAFSNCYVFLSGYEVYKWKLPLMYDLEYLLQRKYLFRVLLEQCQQYGIGLADYFEKIQQVLQEQQQLLGKIYMGIWKDVRIEERDFQRLSESEKLLACTRIETCLEF